MAKVSPTANTKEPDPSPRRNEIAVGQVPFKQNKKAALSLKQGKIFPPKVMSSA